MTFLQSPSQGHRWPDSRVFTAKSTKSMVSLLAHPDVPCLFARSGWFARLIKCQGSSLHFRGRDHVQRPGHSRSHTRCPKRGFVQRRSRCRGGSAFARHDGSRVRGCIGQNTGASHARSKRHPPHWRSRRYCCPVTRRSKRLILPSSGNAHVRRRGRQAVVDGRAARVLLVDRKRTRSGFRHCRVRVVSISKRTLQAGAQGRRLPSGAAQVLIRRAHKHPEMVREALT